MTRSDLIEAVFFQLGTITQLPSDHWRIVSPSQSDTTTWVHEHRPHQIHIQHLSDRNLTRTQYHLFIIWAAALELVQIEVSP